MFVELLFNVKGRYYIEGKNDIGRCVPKLIKLIASFLQLPDSALYTGHCFRRSSASFLVDGDGDLLSLKNHGGWKSSTVAEAYVEKSLTKTIQEDFFLY